jgi:hypothetical protein
MPSRVQQTRTLPYRGASSEVITEFAEHTEQLPPCFLGDLGDLGDLVVSLVKPLKNTRYRTLRSRRD